MYRFLYLIGGAVGLLLGVVQTAKTPAMTDKVKKAVSVVFFLLLVAFVVIAIVNKAWIVLAIGAVILIFAPGVGRTATLLATGRAKQIGAVSWILTLLFLAAVVYAAVTGKLIA